jgi:hypothetical protein
MHSIARQSHYGFGAGHSEFVMQSSFRHVYVVVRHFIPDAPRASASDVNRHAVFLNKPPQHHAAPPSARADHEVKKRLGGMCHSTQAFLHHVTGPA